MSRIIPDWLNDLLPARLGQHLLLMLLVSGTATILFSLLTPLTWLETQLFDLRSYFAGQREPSDDLILINLAETERLDLLAFLNKLPRQGCLALGLDVPGLTDLKLIHDLEQFSTSKALPVVLAATANYNAQGKMQRIQRAAPSEIISQGLVYYPLDRDGTIRRQTLGYRYRNTKTQSISYLPSFAYALYQQTKPSKAFKSLTQAYLFYPGPHNPYPMFTLSELKKQSPEQWKNKILVFTERGLNQRGRTPFRVAASRPELHAYAISGLIEQRLYRRSELFNAFLPLFLALAGLLALWLSLKWGWLVSSLALLTLLFSYFTLNVLIFRYLGLWLDLITPSLSLLCGSAAVMLFFHRTEGQTRRELYSTFRRHLPDQKVRALMDRQTEVLTQNERRIVTVMFTDIQGFSRMGEKLPTDQIIGILNEYLTAMTEIIFANQGTLDKYIGDGIMAVYGNIGSNNPKQDAYYAVKTALEMQTKMAELQRKWMNEGIRPIQIRIGINTGEALVGHVGHPKRKEVTVIGDTVNTSARIEKLNKQYHTHILIAHSTYEYVRDRTEVRPLGEERLQGKSSSVMVYEVRGWKGQNNS